MESHLVESCSIFEVFPQNVKFPTFCGVSLPAPHAISTKDILYLLTHFHFGPVTEKVCRDTAVNDLIREDAGNHGYALQGINIGED
jgi:hypothetical protein